MNIRVVNWYDHLPTTTKVSFSNLCIPDIRKSSLERNVAELILPNGVVVDIEWSLENNNYILTFFIDNFEEPLMTGYSDTPEIVINTIKEYWNSYGSPEINWEE